MRAWIGADGVLKEYGLGNYAAILSPGEQVVEVPPDFNKKAGFTKFNGSVFVDFTPPPSGLQLALNNVQSDMTVPTSVKILLAQLVGKIISASVSV